MSQQNPHNPQEARQKNLHHLLLWKHRDHFPVLADYAYLNFGAQGLLPRDVTAAVSRSFEHMLHKPPFTAEGMAWARTELAETRAAIASSLGARAQDIALTESTSMGCDIVLWGFPWKPGDRLLLSDSEYSSLIATVQILAERFHLAVDYFPTSHDTRETMDAFVKALRPETRMAVVSHVCWNTGRVLPIGEMAAHCRQCSGPRPKILVDGAQSVGVLPIDLNALAVDFYAFTGHKWLCGPEGLGALFIHPESFDSLSPTYLGPRSLDYGANKLSKGFHEDARRFELSTTSIPLHAGLRAALALHKQWAPAEARYRRIRTLSQRLWEGLQQLPKTDWRCFHPKPPDAGIVFFKSEHGSPKDWSHALEEHRTLLRWIPGRVGGLGEDSLRASIHYFTSEEEIDRLLAKLAKLKIG